MIRTASKVENQSRSGIGGGGRAEPKAGSWQDNGFGSTAHSVDVY